MKTKPTQHSVKELRSIGLSPDVLVCRSEVDLPKSARGKIALFTNVEERAVIAVRDADTIYQIPAVLHDQKLDEIVVDKLGLECPKADLSEWQRVVDAQLHPLLSVRIAIVGKYLDLLDAYKSLIEAITHAGIQLRTQVEINYVDAEDVESQGTGILEGVHAVLVPGGFGERGFEGKIQAARWARETKVPYLGICYGLHSALVEFARDAAGIEGADSTEVNPNAREPVIGLVTEWIREDGEVEVRSQDDDLGGTMRLGEQTCVLEPGSLAARLYQRTLVKERHRHRYEVNDRYIPQMEQNGLLVSGRAGEHGLVEIIEIPEHPWFLACQFHPEFTSSPRDGHPLFSGFIDAANQHAGNESVESPAVNISLSAS